MCCLVTAKKKKTTKPKNRFEKRMKKIQEKEYLKSQQGAKQ